MSRRHIRVVSTGRINGELWQSTVKLWSAPLASLTSIGALQWACESIAAQAVSAWTYLALPVPFVWNPFPLGWSLETVRAHVVWGDSPLDPPMLNWNRDRVGATRTIKPWDLIFGAGPAIPTWQAVRVELRSDRGVYGARSGWMNLPACTAQPVLQDPELILWPRFFAANCRAFIATLSESKITEESVAGDVSVCVVPVSGLRNPLRVVSVDVSHRRHVQASRRDAAPEEYTENSVV